MRMGQMRTGKHNQGYPCGTVESLLPLLAVPANPTAHLSALPDALLYRSAGVLTDLGILQKQAGEVSEKAVW